LRRCLARFRKGEDVARRIFITYEGHDRNRAKGFNLLRWNTNVDLKFVGRHLLDPVKSQDSEYVSRKIREQIKGSSVTVVLIGEHTAESEWVDKEVRWSLEKESPNGVLGIQLLKDATVPTSLVECGAEVVPWKPSEFAAAIERAARQAGRIRAMRKVSAVSSGCVRS
jgi:hypothetical protein